MTPQQRTALKTWLVEHEEINKTFWFGYPLGKSYIDVRARGGKGYRKKLAWVRRDAELAKIVPEASGLYPDDIRKLIAR